MADAIRNGIQPRTIVSKAAKFTFYPVVAPSTLMDASFDALSKHGLKGGIMRVPFEYLRRDGVTLVGFVLFYENVGGSPVAAFKFYVLPNVENREFQEATARPPRTDGILVYVDAVPDNNALTGYGASDFSIRFGEREGAHYLRVTDVSNMMVQLRELSERTGRPIAELEILGHGMPGSIEIGSQQLSASSMKAVQGSAIPFAKDATIRLQSCLLGANFRGPLGQPGETFMKGLGDALLNEGGEVMASNHVIYVTDHFPKSARTTERSWGETFSRMAMEPLDLAVTTGMELIKSNDGDYRTIRIERD